MHNLKDLNLDNNKITYIPAELSFLKNLTELNIKENKIAEFPFFVLDLPDLRFLGLKENPIENYEQISDSIYAKTKVLIF